jgi:hypothetical protein
MALPGESPDVTPEAFVRLLSATLLVPGVVESHIHALKVVGEDLLEMLRTIDRVS